MTSQKGIIGVNKIYVYPLSNYTMILGRMRQFIDNESSISSQQNDKKTSYLLWHTPYRLYNVYSVYSPHLCRENQSNSNTDAMFQV